MNEQRNELINNENNNSQKLAHGYLLKEWTNLHECLNRVQEEEKSQRKNYRGVGGKTEDGSIWKKSLENR